MDVLQETIAHDGLADRQSKPRGGWVPLSLEIARRLPRSTIIAVLNSLSQRRMTFCEMKPHPWIRRWRRFFLGTAGLSDLRAGANGASATFG